MTTYWLVLRYGIRNVGRKPHLTFPIVAIIALAIGINTAVFSVVDAALFRPLPFQEANRLVAIHLAPPKLGFDVPTQPLDKLAVWREQVHTFDFVEAYAHRNADLTGEYDPLRVSVGMTTVNLFARLGVKPAIGRLFDARDSRGGTGDVVMISHDIWKSRFEFQTDIIGKSISLDSEKCTIVGVTPPGFYFPIPDAVVWRPITIDNQITSSSQKVSLLARIQEGVSLRSAQNQIDTISYRLNRENPDKYGWDARLVSLQELRTRPEIRKSLLMLWGAASLILIVAFANTASLILSHASERQHAMAIRHALGARRPLLFAHALAESTLLAMVGGGVGVLLGLTAVGSLGALIPARMALLNFTDIAVRFDLRILGYATTLAFMSALFLSAFLAMNTMLMNISGALRNEALSGRRLPRYDRIRTGLVVLQIGLTLTLLTVGAILFRSFIKHQGVEPGYDTEYVLVAKIPLNQERYAEESRRSAFVDVIAEKANNLPGVTAATVTSAVPAEFDEHHVIYGPIQVEGIPYNHNELQEYTTTTAVAPDYFRTLGIPILQGNTFTGEELAGEARAAIVSAGFRDRHFYGANPIGSQFSIGPYRGVRVIGVADNVRQLDRNNRYHTSHVYFALRQSRVSRVSLIIKSAQDPYSLAKDIQGIIWRVDKNLPFSEILTMSEIVARRLDLPRFYTATMLLFATLSIFIAGVGIYGLLVYWVRIRNHELGVRIALGANLNHIQWLVVRQALKVTLLGVVISLFTSFWLAKSISSWLHGVEPWDPASFLVSIVLMMGLTIIASIVPARRAMRVDPMITLRYE